MKPVWALAAVAAVPLAALAQTYKWKDQNGQVHFSQVPPKDGKVELINPPPPPASNPNQESLNKALSDAQKAQPEKQKTADEAARKQAERQDNCRKAREQLAYLDVQTPRRLATTDDQGNVSRMTDEEFERRRNAEQDRIKQNCD